MKPYYEQDGITIYHGDCRDVLPQIDRNSIDLIVTDPPYGVNWQGRKRTMRNGPMLDKLAGDDGSLDVPAALGLALKTLKRGHHVYIFGEFDLSDLPLASPVQLIWDKGLMGVGDLSLPWGKSHEPITFAVHEISKRNRELGYGKLTARMRRGTVLRVQRAHSGQVSRHPTEKPVILLRQLIESSSCMGDTVLDPFMGCGSTLVAAQQEGRSAIGVEVDEGYCTEAVSRLRQVGQSAMELFA